MRHRTSMKLALIFLALAAAGPLLAFDGLKLEGSLSDPTSVSVLRRTTRSRCLWAAAGSP